MLPEMPNGHSAVVQPQTLHPSGTDAQGAVRRTGRGRGSIADAACWARPDGLEVVRPRERKAPHRRGTARTTHSCFACAGSTTEPLQRRLRDSTDTQAQRKYLAQVGPSRSYAAPLHHRPRAGQTPQGQVSTVSRTPLLPRSSSGLRVAPSVHPCPWYAEHSRSAAGPFGYSATSTGPGPRPLHLAVRCLPVRGTPSEWTRMSVRRQSVSLLFFRQER